MIMIFNTFEDPFGIDFGSILGPKIGPKSTPKGISKVLKIMIVFQCLLEPQKIDFWIDMAPTWLDFGPQDGPKLAPKWCQNRSKNGLGSEVGSRTDVGTILGRFWDPFWSILGRFSVDLGRIFGFVRLWASVFSSRIIEKMEDALHSFIQARA